jgi:NAD(P)H-dependent FMN reductase
MSNILILEGSTRPNGSSYKAVDWMQQIAPEFLPDLYIKRANPNEFNLPFDGAKDPKYTELVIWAQAFIILVPEYNHGYPGKLKTLLDSELENYADKPAMLVGWTSGGYGGVRGVQNLLPVVRELGLFATSTNFHFSRHKTVFDEQGNLIDPSYNDKFQKALEELVRVQKLLKPDV